MNKDRNRQLLGIDLREGSRDIRDYKALITEDKSEEKSNFKVFTFEQKDFKEGEHDEILYAITSENKMLSEAVEKSGGNEFAKAICEHYGKAKGIEILTEAYLGDMDGKIFDLMEAKEEGFAYLTKKGDVTNPVARYMIMENWNVPTIIFDLTSPEKESRPLFESVNDFILRNDESYGIL